MNEPISTFKEKETAILVAIIGPHQRDEVTQEYLAELEFLAQTLGAITLRQFVQRLDKPDTKTFIGSGKLEEIKTYMEIHKTDMVIFDDELTPSQVRNLEKELKVKIYDRSLLILDIFLNRAKTAQAKTQVELARYQYLLPRLTRMWTHLERQRGGTGTRGGAGEKEIETDRRNIRNQITVLKGKLAKIEKQALTQRKSRSSIVKVALVGYTNVGKSTLMNLLAKSEVFAEDKLFATVDSTVRKVVMDTIPFLLTDTVGFIRKLPHHLIECFKSTLDEIREADILLHVVDISNPAFHDHIEVVNATLAELDSADKPTLMVFNKIDQYQEEPREEETEEEAPLPQEPLTERLKATFLNKEEEKEVVFVSAIQRQNIDELKDKLLVAVKKKHFTIFPNFLKNEIY
jgi:GTPase